MKSNEYSEEKILYIIGLIGISCMAIFLLILSVLNINISDINIPCAILEKTGYYCPGCGGTRAVKALLHGDILSSLKYHPLVLYIVIVFGAFMILNTISLIFKRDFSGMRVKTSLLLSMPVIIVIQFMIKNLLLIIWNIRII
ncbi:MAG: DUF2752 domain-containing protein [Clostridia bacterium]|nr:DUF2752 domain-containing protein [Clostridia bacterium]